MVGGRRMCAVDGGVRMTVGWRLWMVISSPAVVFLGISPRDWSWRRVHCVQIFCTRQGR